LGVNLYNFHIGDGENVNTVGITGSIYIKSSAAVLDGCLHNNTTNDSGGDIYMIPERKKSGVLHTIEGREKDLHKQNRRE